MLNHITFIVRRRPLKVFQISFEFTGENFFNIKWTIKIIKIISRRESVAGMEKERFQYYVFISYSHLDQKWAKWLQKKLENYQLPSIIRKESDGNLPKYIRPVFRDQTDLGIGKLDLSIRQELADSRYLIVICSPNSAKSEYVNKEIKSFQEMGRGDRIIPFIIDGSTDAKEDNRQCYPPALRDESDLILGASLKELKPEEALIKTVAAILGLKYPQLYMRHQRRDC